MIIHESLRIVNSSPVCGKVRKMSFYNRLGPQKAGQSLKYGLRDSVRAGF